MKHLYLVLAFLFFAKKGFADVHYLATLQGRSKPASVNLFGMAAFDGLLWGQALKENLFYGYYRLGLKAGGNPTYAGFLQVAPISPLIFEVQKGHTHRFVKISTIDCDSVECKGSIERTDYSVRALAAYANFVLFGNATWREIQTPDTTMAVGLEQENFVVSPGFHRYFETSFTIGYQSPENKFTGVLINNGLLSEGNRKNSSVYAIYRGQCEDYGLLVGLGNYRSEAPGQDGFSAIFSLSKSWGSKLSLF